MRILVIEDEPRILAFLARGLEAEGFTVDGAPDGPVAFHYPSKPIAEELAHAG